MEFKRIANFSARCVLLLIALVPFNIVRIYLYRIIFNYHISYSSYIGMFNYLKCAKCEIENEAYIGVFNLIEVDSLIMDDHTLIKIGNRIRGAVSIHLHSKAKIIKFNKLFGARQKVLADCVGTLLTLGVDSELLTSSLVDLNASIIIGKNVVFGGCDHELWTHSFSKARVKKVAPITIGDNIYFGSRCILLPGVSVVSDTEIGAGTVVSKSIAEPGLYVSSSLVRKSR